MNVVSLVGVVAKQPELERTKGGTAACVVTLGVDRPHKRDVTDWVRCQAYGRTAEWLCKWFNRGDRLGVTGCICCDEWQDRDGKRQHMWYVLIDRAEFVERRRAVRDDSAEYIDLTQDAPF